MIGTVQRRYLRNTWCDIKVDGDPPNSCYSRWILTDPPRDGNYTWLDPTLPAGTRVRFDRRRGSGIALPGGTFETTAVAINVTPL